MSSNGFYPSIRQETIAVGEPTGVAVSGVATPETVLRVEDRLPGAPLFGMVSCDARSTVPLVFSLQQSNDQEGVDAFTAINIRVGGAAVASVTVQPGGRVVFSVETTLTKEWIKIKSTQAAYGIVSIAGYNVRFHRRPTEG